ncbi:bifunctional metallophosphatase/5'-nucleotidase [Aureibacillus halotolerans]|uniref:2',3'-cyclic-nucleotide 2'-phosphodiesterase (5'-nucleotidase family) n=1 Tax=Aureibacillus halotolerans TaxID=1508390 RepID=A0A4R6TWR6_9BACI|nr:5'-nucleotidase C-terminal domain-containing protein [Aureibacillus halotolerans]TDQ38310.1 2',3'-cyclic-nucleotide 2'-phosphodiesterase (5'-nucleotidase family) [Aureibacillus halotolerans]
MKKLAIGSTLGMLLAVGFVTGEQATANTKFQDVQRSPMQETILALNEKGIVSDAQNFYPDRSLTKAEAATLLVRAFKLPEIEPTPSDDPNVVKKHTYEDPLAVIDESFTVPSADDITDHWGYHYIEGALEVRVQQVEGEQYLPDSPVSKARWVEMVIDTVYGVDQSVNAVEKAVEIGIATAEEATDTAPVSREDAAVILAKLIENPDFKVITVFATSDIHGHLEPYAPTEEASEIGGLARMSTVINDMRDVQPNTLLVDAGDAPYNTNIANLFEGRSTIDVMNALDYDAMVLGNHDFDYPMNVMQANAERADFPFLSANTLYHGERPDHLDPYYLTEVDGVDIAVIGVTDDESHFYTHPKNVEGVSFVDEFESAQATVDAVKDESDVVIALSHLHGDNKVLPTVVDGIDVEIGGGEDLVAFPQIIQDTWLISPGKHSEVLNQINLNMMGDDMLGLNFAHIFMTSNLEEDPAVASIIADYRSQLDGKMQEVVGSTSVLLDGERQTVRLKESNLGNTIADSLRHMTGADIALQNGGGIRTSITPGEITLQEIYAVLPFDNAVVTAEASGQTIWDTLEHSVSSYPAAAGGFMQVSGMSYTFDAANELGSRMTEVNVGGQPIDLEKTYTVATNDFLTGGGDKFTMLKEDATVISQTKSFLRDAFYDYLKQHETINPELEGRITVLNPVESGQ